MNSLSALNMKKVLWDTLNKLQNNKIDVAVADAIASQSREIVRVIRSQQSIIKQAGENVTKELVDYATKG